MLVCAGITNIMAEDYVYVWRNGNVIFQTLQSNVDSFAVNSTTRNLYLFDKNKKNIYSIGITNIDSISLYYDTPTADLLDVKFMSTGVAYDMSPMKMTINNHDEDFLSTYYNPTYNRYVAKFNQQLGMYTNSYYRIDYSSNSAFKEALADGHTVEAIFMVDYDTSEPCANGIKFFAGHESGGTGFSLSTNTHLLYYTVGVSTTSSPNYCSPGSDIAPQNKVYYDVVGVWDKENSKAYIYVNGALKKSMDAPGNFVFPATAAQWFCIGGDACASYYATNSFNGDVVASRIYDKHLSGSDVKVLWNNLQLSLQKDTTTMITDFTYMSGLPIKKGVVVKFGGKGFQSGDRLRMESANSSSNYRNLSLTLIGTDSASITIPSSFATGKYRMYLVRGSVKQDLGLIYFYNVATIPTTPKVYAHRGFWNTTGSAENSLAAYKKACEAGCDGMETDVWLTTDDSIMINHDATLNNVTIQTSSYNKVKGLTLGNGETIPRLRQMLDLVQQNNTHLLIEIKEHSTLARGKECAKATYEIVKAYGVLDKVEFHSPSYDIGRYIISLDSSAFVSSLDYQAPAQLKADGFKCLTSLGGLYNHTSQVSQFKSQDIKCWPFTPDQVSLFNYLIQNGAECVGTNNVQGALRLKHYYEDNQDK